MEMDRPLGYYHNPKLLTLIYKEKKYSTMYMNENGSDVMILKCVNGKFHVMAATKEKCIERVSDDEKSGTRSSFDPISPRFLFPPSAQFTQWHCSFSQINPSVRFSSSPSGRS